MIVGKSMLVKNGKNFGINEFGKSAPFKEIYKYFGLTKENITNKSKNLIKKLIMTIKVELMEWVELVEW